MLIDLTNLEKVKAIIGLSPKGGRGFMLPLVSRFGWNPRPIIFEKIKAIWYPIPKNSSTSIKKYFTASLGLRAEVDIFGFFRKQKYKEYFRFAFVRNPFDRLVSCFESKINRPKITDKYFLEGLPRDFYNPDKKFYSGMSFKQFVEAIFDTPDEISDPHFKSQYKFVSKHDGIVDVDFVGKIENINHDFKIICDKIGVACEDLPITNRIERSDYRKYYDEEITRMVVGRYENDFDFFGYDSAECFVNKRYCLCCGSNLKEFDLPNSGNPQCPHCKSYSRHRGLMNYFFQNDCFKVKTKVLDIAPTFAIKNFLNLNSHVEYISMDLDSSRADMKADMRQMPFETGTFDFAMCSHVLEHIDDDSKAIQELFRVMKKGGVAIVIVPLSRNASTYEDFSIVTPEERNKAFGQWNHVRKCGQDYIDRLVKAGFITKKMNLSDGLTMFFAERYGINRDEVAFLCIKPQDA